MRSRKIAAEKMPDQGFSSCLVALLLTSFLLLGAMPLLAQEAGQTEKNRDLHTKQMLESILKAAPTGIGVVKNRVLVQVNDYILDLTGYAREELLGQSARMLYPTQEDSDYVGQEKYRQIAERGTGSVETRWLRKDGGIRYVILSSTPLDPADLGAGVTFTVLDITDRKMTEKRLLESEERFSALFNNHAAVMLLIDPNSGKIRDANPAAAGYYGWARDRLVGMHIHDINTLSPEEMKQEMQRAKTRARTYFEFRHRKADGSIRDVAVFSSGIPMGAEVLLYSIIHDITDQKQAEATLANHARWFFLGLAALVLVLLGLVGRLVVSLRQRKRSEEALLESEKQYRELFENAPMGIFQSTPGGRYLSLNPEYARIMGYATPEEMIEQIYDISTHLYARPEERERYKDHLRQHGSARNFEAELKRHDGEIVWVSLNTKVHQGSNGQVVYSGFLTDITDFKRAEAEREKLQSLLLQAQKMESMGILAGGVAHDFNNLLQAMGGNIELLMQGKPADHPDARRLKTVTKSIDRAAQLVQQLLLFSRKAESRRMRVDLNQEVEGVARMLERTIPKMIALELHLDTAAWPLFADPVQIEQILLNLASNAVDAMPDGGKLIIETGNVELDENFVRMHPGTATGPSMLLTVSDTGCGMDKKVLEHIYDPFFTTKEIGKGTGLGLASVYGIVKAHGGHIQCYSEPGIGTTFKIYFPAGAQDETGMEPSAYSDALQGGNETILVVDDDPEILELTQDALEMLGYSVKMAVNGEQALVVYREYGKSIDLVLLDLNMPGMGGHRCLKELVQLDPQVKVVIASGYTANGHGKDALSSGAKGFIGKPYRLKELAAMVREVLDGKEAVTQPE